MATHEKKLLTPKDNKLQISNQRDFKFYNFLVKIFLKTFETVELHALGEAISLSVRVAENMSRFGYASITKIEQLTFHPDEKENNQIVTCIMLYGRKSSVVYPTPSTSG